MRRAAKVDANQKEIVNEFRKLGCTVTPLHMVGQGCPDLVIGISGVNVLVEVKDGSKPPSERRLTDDQVLWHSAWRGMKVEIVISKADVVQLVNRIRGCS